MNRREFIAGLGSAAAWPVVASAQQPKMPVIGFFNTSAPNAPPLPQLTAAFREGLREQGFVEGRNLVIEYRWAENQYDRLPALAADLVRRRVAVIVANPRAVDAARALTTTIPIVFLSGADPVRAGLVASINRPGGNLTGAAVFAGELNAKRFGLFHDMIPQAAVIGVLSDSTNPRAEFVVQQVQTAARDIGVAVRTLGAGTEKEVEIAFATFAHEGISALFLNNGLFFYGLAGRLGSFAAQHRMALSGEQAIFVEAGGLMSYGADEPDAFRHIGRYAGRILKGEKPGDLPVLLPTKFEFVINLKTAKALGLIIPETLLATADEVIQ
jgi:putative tryptophan/tyrosine transport system substrate-binding protein